MTIPLDEARRRRDGPAGPPRLSILDPLRWEGQPIPDRRWIVEQWVPLGAVTMLSGDGGLGKSLLTMQLLVSTAMSQPWLGLPVLPCKSLAVFCEDDPEELHRRMNDICKHGNIPFSDLENMRMISRVGQANEFLRRDKYGKQQGPSDFYFQVLDEAKRFGAQLVVLDGLHDLFDGNENSRPEARSFVNLLRRIALETDGGVLLNAHPSMAGLSSGSGNSGSTAWNNAVRQRLYLTRPKDDDDRDADARVLKTMKSNYGKIGEEIKLRWQEGVFVRDEPDAGFVANLQKRAHEKHACDAFLNCLDASNKQGRHVTDAHNSPRYAPKVFAEMPEARGVKIKAIERAMSSLFNDGTIKIGSILDPYRKPQKAIVRAAGGVP